MGIRVDVHQELQLLQNANKKSGCWSGRVLGQGGCEPRIEIIVKIQEKAGGPVGSCQVGAGWGSGWM